MLPIECATPVSTPLLLVAEVMVILPEPMFAQVSSSFPFMITGFDVKPREDEDASQVFSSGTFGDLVRLIQELVG